MRRGNFSDKNVRALTGVSNARKTDRVRLRDLQPSAPKRKDKPARAEM